MTIPGTTSAQLLRPVETSQPLPNEYGWQAGIIEQVTLHPHFLELQISIAGCPVRRVFVKHGILDRYGLGDASSLAERPVFLTTPTDGDLVRLIPAARRVDYSQGSPVPGWLHPPEDINGNGGNPEPG